MPGFSRMRAARVSAVAGVALFAVIVVRLVLFVLGGARPGAVDIYLYVIAAVLISNTCSYHWGREDGARHERQIIRQSRRIRRGAAPGDASLTAWPGILDDWQAGRRVGPSCLSEWRSQCSIPGCRHMHATSPGPLWLVTSTGPLCPCHPDVERFIDERPSPLAGNRDGPG